MNNRQEFFVKKQFVKATIHKINQVFFLRIGEIIGARIQIDIYIHNFYF